MAEAPLDRWLLRRGDLPSRRTLAAEPNLAGLEGNPVFRVLTPRARGARRWAWLWAAAPWLVAFLPAVTRRETSEIMAVFTAVWLPLLLLTALARRGIQLDHLMRRKILFSIPTQFLGDVLTTPLPAKNVAAALWGDAVRADLIRGRWAGLAAALVFVGTGYFWPIATGTSIGLPSHKGIFLAAFSLLSFQAALLAFAPHHALLGKASLLDYAWEGVQAPIYSLYVLRVMLLRAVSLAALAVTVAVIFGPPIFLWSSYNFLPENMDPLKDAHVSVETAMIILAGVFASLGAIPGLAVGYLLRRRAKTDFNQMTGQVAFLLNWIGRAAAHEIDDEEDLPFHRRMALLCNARRGVPVARPEPAGEA